MFDFSFSIWDMSKLILLFQINQYKRLELNLAVNEGITINQLAH